MNPSRRRFVAFCSLFAAYPLLPANVYAEEKKPKCLEKTLTKGKWEGKATTTLIKINSISSENGKSDLFINSNVKLKPELDSKYNESEGILDIEITYSDSNADPLIFQLNNSIVNFDFSGDEIRLYEHEKSPSISVNGDIQAKSPVQKGILLGGKLQHLYGGTGKRVRIQLTENEFDQILNHDEFVLAVIYKNQVMYQRTFYTQEFKSLLKELTQFQHAEKKRNNDGQCEACFITTAACDVVGLQDDCFELKMLRIFRDTYLAKTELGEVEIKQYYTLAPMVLNAMKKSDSAKSEFLKLYWLSIVPSVIFTCLGLNQITHWLYKRMMKNLIREWL